MQKNVDFYVNLEGGGDKSSKSFSNHSYEKIMHIIIIQITLSHIVPVLSMYISRVKIKILQR